MEIVNFEISQLAHSCGYDGYSRLSYAVGYDCCRIKYDCESIFDEATETDVINPIEVREYFSNGDLIDCDDYIDGSIPAPSYFDLLIWLQTQNVYISVVPVASNDSIFVFSYSIHNIYNDEVVVINSESTYSTYMDGLNVALTFSLNFLNH
jgi:hypothetical protein